MIYFFTRSFQFILNRHCWKWRFVILELKTFLRNRYSDQIRSDQQHNEDGKNIQILSYCILTNLYLKLFA